MNCRHCATDLTLQMVDLGSSPVANAFNTSADGEEKYYPLRVMVCTSCWLAQTDISLFRLDHDELFTDDYPYFSSTSKSWVEHAKEFVEMATERFKLGPESLTVEIGANDGYLLQWMKTPCCGIEPTRTGEVAKKKGLEIYPKFFTAAFADNFSYMGKKADLVVANNVLAHVPDINDFVKGVAILLKDEGTAVFEFPHLLTLVRQNQFDTIYHEHYSYLSLTAIVRIFASQDLHVFDVEKLSTHGGSLRVYASKAAWPKQSVVDVLVEERHAGMKTPAFYQGFQQAAERVKDEFIAFLLRSKQMGLTVAAFGAAAKGNTFLNFAGVKSDLISHVVDDTPAKQGKFLPGSRIPVVDAFHGAPDFVVVLPWNFREAIMEKLGYVREWGGKFVFAIPRLKVA